VMYGREHERGGCLTAAPLTHVPLGRVRIGHSARLRIKCDPCSERVSGRAGRGDWV
jgi:hypothetical protein